MKTTKQCIDSTRELELYIYLLGRQVTNYGDHTFIRLAAKCIATTYDLAEEADCQLLGEPLIEKG